MKLFSFLWVLSLLLTQCTAPKPNPQSALDVYFNTLFDSTNPGAAVLVRLGDSILLEKGYGLADLKSKISIDPNTIFNIGSISKTFVAYGILLLEQENKLSLNDSLIQYFSDFKKVDLAQKVKLYHLLTHSSGLPDNRPTERDSIFYLTADDAQNWAPIMQNDRLDFESGSRYHYSNPAFNALALIIQKQSSQKWQSFISEKIFKPSKMHTSTITDGSHPDSGVAHAYISGPNNSWVERDYMEEPTFNASGNGGVWSSIRELSAYEYAIQNHLFADASIIEKSRSIFPLPAWQDTLPSFMGLSWFLGQKNGLKMISHTGSQGGFTADFVSIPEKQFFYCILSNQPMDVERLRHHVLQMVFK